MAGLPSEEKRVRLVIDWRRFMRKRICLAILGVIVLIGLSAQSSHATLDTQMWQINDTDNNADNVFAISASWLLDSLPIPAYDIDAGGFYVYADADNDGVSDSSLQIFGNPLNPLDFYRSIMISDSNILTVANVTGSLNLGASGYFGFYFTDDSGNRTGTYVLNLADDGLSYDLSSGGATVTISDASPIPLPPAAILLGSGLVGLMGFGVRRKRGAA
jgi:hypothetical protein